MKEKNIKILKKAFKLINKYSEDNFNKELEELENKRIESFKPIHLKYFDKDNFVNFAVIDKNLINEIEQAEKLRMLILTKDLTADEIILLQGCKII